VAHDPEIAAYEYGMIPAALFGYLPPGAQPIPPVATVFTSMFLHGGWLHLGGNMLFLWIFGNNMEDLLGRGRYLVLYLGGGVAAALVQALSAKYSTIPMVGASGAVAGVLGAYLVTYPRANVHVFVWIIIFFWIVTVPAWILLGFWFGTQLLSGLAGDAGSPGVAFWAHVGGFAAGTLLYLAIRPRRVHVLQAQRTPVWAAAPPSALTGRRTFYGSVPDSGSRSIPPRSPWE
jgi:membrane associated rhomboid family serine protease